MARHGRQGPPPLQNAIPIFDLWRTSNWCRRSPQVRGKRRLVLASRGPPIMKGLDLDTPVNGLSAAEEEPSDSQFFRRLDAGAPLWSYSVVRAHATQHR